MSRGPVRIANCSGFYGDRLSAAAEMVNGGRIDVLTGDWLAELTMLILSKSRAKNPSAGYATTFVRQMSGVLEDCLSKGIKVVANAGGLNPLGCAEALEALGTAAKITYVHGDDLMDRLADVGLDQPDLITANAYLGCWGIVEALNSGADVVVTGRVTDAAVVCGPAAWHHGWARDDWDRLAGAVVAGHVIECGTQATGGNYSFFDEVAGLERAGFPWVDIGEDGVSVVGKHEGTGGEVSVGTVTSQLLYEIGSPKYLGPDVTADFSTIHLSQLAPDRVEISGVKGEPPPSSLKVSMNKVGGFRLDLGVALVGLDIEAKAALVERAFWANCPYEPGEYESIETKLDRTDIVDPATNSQATAKWSISLFSDDSQKVDRRVANVIVEMALATIPGFHGTGGVPRPGRPFGVFLAGYVDSMLVPSLVTRLGQETVEVSSVAPAVTHFPASEATENPPPSPASDAHSLVRMPLGRILGARSGDKGGDANVGLFAETEEAYTWASDYLTVDRLRELLPEAAELEIDRYLLPNIWSINFVVRGLLGEGVAASTRPDAQAKSLGEWLRAREVRAPEAIARRR